MDVTTYYKLQKPLDTEAYDIDIYNMNLDTIDVALNQFEEKINELLNIIGQANVLLESI